MPVGPQLPPSILDKRKRTDDAEDSNTSDSDSDTGPVPPPPPSSETVAKKQRVIGPTLPPAPLDQRPPEPATKSPPQKDHNESDDSSDDDFGPSLPTTNSTYNSANPSRHTNSVPSTDTIPTAPSAPKRDDWMTLAPSSSDWSSRVDPTKLKNRKFNTGKGAKGPPTTKGDASSAWHETPAEKQARLQREVMGIKEDANGGRAKAGSELAGTSEADRETARRMAEYNKSRGPSLYQSHHTTSTSASNPSSTTTSASQDRDKSKEDDDPSARAFDREKDIGGGLQINATKRREMVKKASDFGSRFASARYL